MAAGEQKVSGCFYLISGLLINQKMGGGRESCAAKATFAPQALQFEVKDAPQALQSRWAEALE